MKLGISIVALAVVAATALGAAPQTWTGQIGDSMCGAKHMPMGGKTMPDRECTEMCVKANARYIFVSGGKVYQIGNQKDSALATHAGHTVLLTGELKNDTITVSKIDMPKADKR
jgi:hypothetical protein